MLWDDLLNSEWHDWRGGGKYDDRLDNSDWLERWLADQHIFIPPPPNEQELQELKQLRSLIHGMVKDIASGNKPTSIEVDKLNQIMAESLIVRQIIRVDVDDSYRLEQIPSVRDWPQIMSDIAFSFAQTLAHGEFTRIRICNNPDCFWVYYDETRNRSKKYCEDKTCGNLMKVRRFRARQKKSSEK